ncbi:MAG: PrsW family intramembrane metalloprotease [Thermoplasmata archaeon]
MSDLDTFLDIIIIFSVALIPAVLYLLWIRGTERYRTSSWGTVLTAFVYGAIVATLVAATIEGILLDVGTSVSQALPAPEFTFLNGNSTAGQFFLILIIAPFVEEGLKGLGVVLLRNRMAVVADGPVFGASVGLGFGFFETVLYGIVGFAVGGLAGAIVLVLVRSVSSVLLHASSTAMFGYGHAKSRIEGEAGATGRYYLLAVGMHASFNALASLGAILIALGVSNSIGDVASGIALLAAVAFAVFAFEHVAKVIQSTDYPSLAGYRGGYRAPPLGRAPPK